MFARVTIVLASILASIVTTSAPVAADPIPGGARDVVAVTSGPVGPRIAVTLSNGARDILRPCAYEDGRHCYWLASEMGNGMGYSLIVTRGRVHNIPTAALARAVHAN